MNCPYIDPSYQKIWSEALAARDREWVEWSESRCSDHPLPTDHFVPVVRLWIEDDTVEYHLHKKDCPDCWQSRLKEIGYENRMAT
jgi:hypothetical protein